MNPTPSPADTQPPPPPVSLSRVLKVLIVLVVIGLCIGFIPRWIHRHRLNTGTVADGIIDVSVISPVPMKADLGTPLPADVQAFIQASIHARASGYLKNWYADIGQQVTNGQVIAEIDTPELDEQIAEARAQVDQAKAQVDLAQVTSDRWSELLKTASVSEQETAEKTSDLALKKAMLESAQANLHRLEDLKQYDQVTAPFAGTITRRNTDIGQLIAADSGPELFRLAQTDPLRVYVQVPQPLVHAIRPGQTAKLIFQELQQRTFTATVTRTAGAVDPSSRTLQVELQVPNPNGDILSGSYAQVSFTEATDPNILTISDNALIFRAQGMQLALLDKDNKVHLQSIVLGRDSGSTVEVLQGLDANDRVIINPPDSIADGMTVRVVQPADATPAAK